MNTDPNETVSRRKVLQTAAVGIVASAMPRQLLAEWKSNTSVATDRRFPYFMSNPVPYFNVKMQDTFWAPRQKVVREVSVPWATRHCDAAGGIDVYKADPKTYRAQIASDDVTTIPLIEGLATAVGVERDPTIEGFIDAWTDVLVGRQCSDGYLQPGPGSTLADPPQRWQPMPLSEETYLIGHYLEAAIAYREATGSTVLYNSALRAVDNMAVALLDSGRPYLTGPEIEQALMRLYGVTGQTKYLRLCEWLLARRGHYEGRISGGKALQDHLPIEEQRTIEGHAVFAAYLFNGVTQYVGATGNAGYRDSVLAAWQDLVERKMYLHGASGNMSSGFEGYNSEPYAIPPGDTYGESCAAVANFRWAHNLFRLTGDAKHVDVAERILYNVFYASLSLKGNRYFYCNVSERFDPVLRYDAHPCPCCPPNIVKLFSKVGGYFYSTDADGIFVKHYGASQAAIPLRNGVNLTQTGMYPWDGHLSLDLEPKVPSTFTIHLRIPAWAQSYRLAVNGIPIDSQPVRGWVSIRRHWQPKDRIELELPMRIERVSMPPQFKDYHNLIALQRGPVVYCLEQQDAEPAAGPSPWGSLYLPADVVLTAEHRSDLLNGVTVLKGVLPQSGVLRTNSAPVTATFVPYGVWNNRNPGAMAIWLPTEATTLASVEKNYPYNGVRSAEQASAAAKTGAHSDNN